MIHFIAKMISVLFFATILTQLILGENVNQSNHSEANSIQHNIIYSQAGKFAAWPANCGMWAWENEILVCFNIADHNYNIKSGHTYDVSTSELMFARSIDGGETWNLENARDNGIIGFAMDHHAGDKDVKPSKLKEPINFKDLDFALLFQRESNRNGPTHFYYTYTRGKTWNGPHKFPELDSVGITNRTDYIIDNLLELKSMLSIGHGRTAIARTDDGGQSWELLSYVGPDFTRSEELVNRNDYSLMPSTVRLTNSDILTTIRHREGDDGKVWITSYLSNDNGLTWNKLEDPVSEHVNSPPALIKLDDGRLVLIYVARLSSWNIEPTYEDGATVSARISSDNGMTWGDEIILREKEGANDDVGYPRVVKRPDGKLVITYYWNHVLKDKDFPYRYISATIWDPSHHK
jgi:hypothetical protein